MKLLIIADIHGDFEVLGEIIEKASRHNPDIVICPGNITDMFKIPPEFSQLDIADMVVQKLISLGKPLLCVPGNHDPYEILDVFKEYHANIHAHHKKISGVTFMGFGGAPTPFNTLFEPTEEETKAHLEKFPANPPSILVTHNPPKNTKLDKLPSGEHVGSQAIREFIEKTHPLCAISAHIHESSGEDRLGETVLFNPGPAFKGNYGIIEIEKNSVKCQLLKIK